MYVTGHFLRLSLKMEINKTTVKVTVWFFPIFDILFRILRQHRISIRKCSKTFFVESIAKNLPKGSKTPVKRFFSSRSHKKKFEQFLIDILCCLNILNKISKIEKKTYCQFKVSCTFSSGGKSLVNFRLVCPRTPCLKSGHLPVNLKT